MDELTAGTQLDRYRLERPLGAGGMGTVWLAHDTELDRKVALKVLRPALAGDDTAQLRLLREARAMAKLRHPNVITVFDAETIGGRDVVAMELVDGETMGAWLARGGHSPDRIADVLVAAGRGLAAAHAAGMVHRDFKPHNVLLDRDGRVLVTDFGLARAMEAVEATAVAAAAPVVSGLEETLAPAAVGLDATVDATPTPARAVAALDATMTAPGSGGGGAGSKGSLDSTLTRTGALLGTPAYMAPEQIRGEVADARADQFAFCVTAWEALAGARPFPGEDLAAILRAILAQQPAAADRVPRTVRAILARGLATDAGARWPAMPELLDGFERAWKRPKKIRMWSQAIGLGLIAFFGIFFAMAALSRHETAPAPPATTAAAGCPRGSDAVAPLWSPAARDNLRAHLGRRADRAIRSLDRWATEWSAAYDANCAAPADPDAAARRLCLEAQRDSLALLAAPADEMSFEAVARNDLSMMLPAPEACVKAPRVITPPPPRDPRLRAGEREVRSVLYALRSAMFDPAIPGLPAIVARGRTIVAELETAQDPEVRGEAVSLRALLVAFEPRDAPRSLDHVLDAYDSLTQAIELAEASGNDRVRANLLLAKLQIATGLPGLRGDLDTLIHDADLVIQHTADPITKLQLDGQHALVLGNRGAWTAAIDQLDELRRAWRARGAVEPIAGAINSEIDLLSKRAAAGDFQRAADLLREAGPLDIGAGTRRTLEGNRRGIAIYAGTADPATIPPQQFTRDAGSPGGTTLDITLTGAPPPTATDDPAARVVRLTPFDVRVRRGDQSWRILPRRDGVFELANVAPGHVAVDAYTPSALGDMQVFHRELAVVAGKPIALAIAIPKAREIDHTLGPYTRKALWGIAVALPGKVHATTAAALRTVLEHAPAWSVTQVHATRSESGVAWTAELAAFATPTTVCTVEGGRYTTDDPHLIELGPADHPVHCGD